MTYVRLVPGLALGLLMLVSCGRTGLQLEPLDPGRVDFIAEHRLLDVRTDRDSETRSLDGFQFLHGWLRSGSGGKWAAGPAAAIEFLTSAENKFLWIECRPDHVLDGPQVVTVVADGVVVGEFSPQPNFGWYPIELPRSQAMSVRHIEMRFDRVRSVDLVAEGGDVRPLALLVRRFALSDDPHAAVKAARRSAIVRTSNGVRIRRAGRLYLNVRSDGAVDQIVINIRQQGGGNTTVPVALVRPDTGERLDQLAVDVRPDDGAAAWLHAGGSSGPFQIIVDVGHDGLVIDHPLASVRSGPPPVTEERTTEKPGQAQQPDIVVIVLDAARADHSGSTYEYFRDTMPHIDRLADDAVVFEKIFAQAPYTTCSVPSMFTGLSWRSHGVVKGKDRLPAGEWTLAESLRRVGYRTIGLTATPNNSKRLGMDQGFDEFIQIWESTSWKRSIDPMELVDQLRSRLHQGLDEEPLFLMLHLVPPHSPYTPPEEYRLWNDPMYDGPCDGTDQYFKSARRNRQEISAADLAEMRALYDANLRFSDAAVGLIFEALADVGRLDDSVIAVTADHGEAFLEHGDLGHNSTIYDEMLQVPLIVRLPPGGGVKEVDAARLASLEDLTPTLLGLAGVAPSPRSTGIDLFSDQSRTGIVIRTTESQGMVGFRSEKWKLIAGGNGRFAELYDLEADQEEKSNILLKHPETASWFADRWDRAEALMPPPLDTAAGATEMTETEKAMLQELGYID